MSKKKTEINTCCPACVRADQERRLFCGKPDCACHKSYEAIGRFGNPPSSFPSDLGWEIEFRNEYAMGNDQTTILGAKGSADRIIDFIRDLLSSQRAEILEEIRKMIPQKEDEFSKEISYNQALSFVEELKELN